MPFYLLALYLLVDSSRANPCLNVNCNSSSVCYFGQCFPALSTDNSGCSQPCDPGDYCLFGHCVADPHVPIFSDFLCNPSCKSTEECRFLNCYPTPLTPCTTSCPTNNECVFGTCIPTSSRCSPSCPSGQWCNHLNTCVYASNSNCSSACQEHQVCSLGLCLPVNVRLSLTLPCGGCGKGEVCSDTGACVSYNAPCNEECSNSSICAYGTCKECSVCEDLQDVFLRGLVNSEVGFHRLNSTVLEFDLSQNPGILEVRDFEIVITQGLRADNHVDGKIDALIFDDSEGVFGISAGTSVEIEIAHSYSPSSAIILPRFVSLQLNNWVIGSGAQIQILFDSAMISENVLSDVNAISLDLQGHLLVSGPGFFHFPDSGADMTSSLNAYVTANGGVSLSGNLGSTALVITQTGPHLAHATIPITALLETGGNIIGENGKLEVMGSLVLTGMIVQPLIYIGSSGKLHTKGNAIMAGNLALAPGAQVYLTTQGATTYFHEILSCPEGATLLYQLNDTFFNLFGHCDVDRACRGTILNYDATTTEHLSLFLCTVRLVDSTGARMTLRLESDLGQTYRAFSDPIHSSSEATTQENRAILGATSLTYLLIHDDADQATSKSMTPQLQAAISLAIILFTLAIGVIIWGCYRRFKRKQEENSYLLESDDEPLPRSALEYN